MSKVTEEMLKELEYMKGILNADARYMQSVRLVVQPLVEGVRQFRERHDYASDEFDYGKDILANAHLKGVNLIHESIEWMSDEERRIFTYQSFVDEFTYNGWTIDSVAKKCNIQRSDVLELLIGNWGEFSIEDLTRFTLILKTKAICLYLDDLEKHSNFLYKFSNLAHIFSAFVGSDGSEQDQIICDKAVAFFMKPITLADGYDLTARGVRELRYFSQACKLLSAIENDRAHLFDELIVGVPPHADIFKVFFSLAKLPLEKKLEGGKLRSDMAENFPKYIGVNAMAAARRRFSDEEKLEIKKEADAMKKNNSLLSWSAIHKRLATKHSVSISTVRRALD